MARFIVGLVLILAAPPLAVLLEGGKPWILLSLPAALVVFVPAFAASAAVFEFSQLLRAFLGAFRGKKPSSRSMDVWRLFGRVALLAGLSGSLLGLAFLWATTPELRGGQALALCLVPLIYGVLAELLARVWRAKIKDRAN